MDCGIKDLLSHHPGSNPKANPVLIEFSVTSYIASLPPLFIFGNRVRIFGWMVHNCTIEGKHYELTALAANGHFALLLPSF